MSLHLQSFVHHDNVSCEFSNSVYFNNRLEKINFKEYCCALLFKTTRGFDIFGIENTSNVFFSEAECFRAHLSILFSMRMTVFVDFMLNVYRGDLLFVIK